MISLEAVMDHPPGSVRVVARATAIIQDPQERFLLTFHEKKGHFFLRGGKAKDRQGRDLTEIFAHPRQAGAYVDRLFAMNRESARDAGVREVWEEFQELEIVSPMRWKEAKKLFAIVSSPDAVKIVNPHDAQGVRYRPDVDTENVILPCRMCLPRKWEGEIQALWKQRDPRIWFASPGEIQVFLTTGLKEISPDVARILLRLGLISTPRERDSRESTADREAEDSEEPVRSKIASA